MGSAGGRPGHHAVPDDRLQLPHRVRADGLKAIVATSANDAEVKSLLQAAAVNDPITGGLRGEQIIYTFAAGQLRRQEIGIDAAPVVVAAGIISLVYTYLDPRIVFVRGKP